MEKKNFYKKILIISSNFYPEISKNLQKGVLNVSSLKIGHNSVSWGRSLPGYSAIKGDIVYNLDCTNSADSPIGWQCLGAYRWRPILSQ